MAIQTFHVGIKAVITDEDKILLVKHKIKGTWNLPGGRIDDDESIEDALRREIREELAVKDPIQIGDIVCAYRDPELKLVEGGGVVLIAYHVTLPKEYNLTISDEHTDIQWMTFDQALEQGSIVQEVVKNLRK